MTDSSKPASRRQPLRVKDLPLVLVEWDDASHDTDHDGSADSAIASAELMTLQDVGWLLKFNKRVVVLAAERCLGDSTCRWIMVIPRSCVRRITLLSSGEQLWPKSSTPSAIPSTPPATLSASSDMNSPLPCARASG